MIKVYASVLLIVILSCISQVQNITICREDYEQTNYNMFCPGNQIVLVNRYSASFVFTNAQRADCIAQPNLILNASNSISNAICNYCFTRQPCIISPDYVDNNGLFNPGLYNIGGNYNQAPVAIGILYQCLDRSVLNAFTQADLCDDPSILTSTRSTTTTTTRTTTTTTTTRTTTFTTTTTTARTTTTPRTFQSTTTTRPAGCRK